ncbi:MAG: carbamoyltransferase [Actinomycetota bacterium]|jgi:carbamoyltransferase|nr:carbamoyltransferase [Actinomycetota bacterium]
MKILGICHDVFICSACVVVDGVVVSAIPEERLDRQKMSSVFPKRAIDACLRAAGLTMADLDEIAVAWNPVIDLETTPAGYLNARRWRVEHLTQVPAQFLKMSEARAGVTASMTDLWPDAPPITYVDHYFAHLGNAVYLSPYDECAVAVVDGRAERRTGMLARFRGTDFEVLEETNFPHSLGLMYGAVTQFLGFQPDSDEWKVMALASYADAENEYLEPMRALFHVDDGGGFRVALEFFEYFNFWDRRMYSDRFVETFGPPRGRDDDITERHQRIAAALQELFEVSMAKILTALHERTGLDRVVLTGGCAMNSVFNGKITSMTPFRECFVTSCPDDSGTAIGAALYLHAERSGTRPPIAPLHNYWGPEFSDEECHRIVAGVKTPNVSIVDDPSSAAAADLVAGALVGWFQGRMEFGQRALGNRSILADPRRTDAKDVVNAAVKYRESFRPFAPAILAEHVPEWFDCPPGTHVPFMERVFRFRPEKMAEVPAVVHEDGTGRLQSVDEATNPRFHALIRSFFEKTGVPIVLNTSFNLSGEPIVCTPQDALRSFFSCGLDVLYLGNVRIEK